MEQPYMLPSLYYQYHMPFDARDDFRSQGTSRHSIDQINWNIYCLYFLSDQHDITQLKFCNLSSDVSAFIIPPPNEVEGGGGYSGFTLSVHLSVRPSVCL